MHRCIPVLHRLSVFGVALVLGACRDPAGLLEYENRRPFTPPMDTYGRWWEEVEACVERSRDLAGIRWYLADRISQGFGSPVDAVRGQWLSTREITIKSGHEGEFRVVKHEMLHDLLDGDGSHEHRSWRTCDEREGMPGEPFLPVGTYDYQLHFTSGLSEWRFQGTLTVSAARPDRVDARWEVEAVAGDGPASYKPTATRGAWDYDAYVIGAQVSGAATWEIWNRVAYVDGEARCLIAHLGGRGIPCRITGPR